MARHKTSPFLASGPRTTAQSLAIVQLSRDNLQPLYLQDTDGEHDGYAEGAVFNTRFGSFPHSTFLDIPWGSQVRASKVDTGSRGRKRKLGDVADVEQEGSTPADSGPGDTTPRKEQKKEAVTASTGFVHILPPTPEIWTMSLPHRTQVVYTPDYSYILHRIRARPGTQLIEAGAGSGSFTHAAARAVYNGYPIGKDGPRKGKVSSFEYHEERFQKMTAELKKHELDGVVDLTHRNVYEDGFLVDGASPGATAVFLDLPAPWRALPHLSRQKPKDAQGEENDLSGKEGTCATWVSPLDPKQSVYICTFSPCIEQVTRTISTMRRLGWAEIEMLEITNKKVHVLREKIGTTMPAARGFNQSPRNVGEAVARLKVIEDKFREHNSQLWQEGDAPSGMEVDGDEVAEKPPNGITGPEDGEESSIKPWMDGQLVTRTEPELKAHTSYLVFAVLPREWTEQDEAAASAKWPCGKETQVIGTLSRQARKEQKRKALEAKSKKS